MTDSRKIVKVFIASPGDLADERKAAKEVVNEFNELLAEEFSYQVELVGWEDTVSVFGRPQETINREIFRCELFVGIMWKHWGTPPDIKGPYTSGFEEEYFTAVKRRLSEGCPEISLFFKEIDSDFLKDPGEGLKKVLSFKDQLIAEKKILFENFKDVTDFEKKFRRCLTNNIRNLKAKEVEESSSLNQSQAPLSKSSQGNAPEKESEADLEAENPFSVNGARFLREFIAKTVRNSEEDSPNAVEVARVRLLANLIGSRGNDERSLGVHDSNLLFTEGSKFDFGRPELVGLLLSGLEHYPDENVPLWHWYSAMGGFRHKFLNFYSLIGSSANVNIGALAAMKLISEPLTSDSELGREAFLDKWFAEDASTKIRVAALEYLAETGVTADLSVIRKEIDRSDYQTSSVATNAYLRVSLRDSREKAITALYELQPVTVSKKIVTDLFEDDTTLNNETLLKGVGHRNLDVRSAVVKKLRKRKALPKAIAEQLLKDDNAIIRYESLMALTECGRHFTKDEAKRILVKQSQSQGTGLGLGLIGRDHSPEICWRNYWQKHLSSLTDVELENIAKQETIFNRDVEFILAERHFKTHGVALRKSIDDQYKSRFSEILNGMIEMFGEADEIIKKTRALEDYTRKENTRRGLDVICRQAKAEDLGRVRAVLRGDMLNYSSADVEYLQKFGEWEDIQLVISCTNRPTAEFSVLSDSDQSKYSIAAKAIYSLANSRLDEIFAMTIPARILEFLIVQMPDKAFSSLNNSIINQLYKSDDASVRKVAAIKSVKSFTKERLVRLLAEINSAPSRYYNVVHWLDFGASTPKERSKIACQQVLAREWSN